MITGQARTALGVALIVICMSSASAAMPRNSFLRESANTQAQLIAQVKKYPEVRDRYMRHFAMTEEEVITYFKGLKLSRTKQDGDYVVYNVPQNTGVLRSKILRLKKGTKVWVDWQGDFVLQWICGNPMGRGPKPVHGDVVADIAAPSADMVPVGTPVPGEAEGPMFATTAEPPTPTFSEALPVNPGFLAPIARSSAPLGLLLLPLLLIKPPNDEPDPVPEPMTMVVMGVGVATLIARRRPR